MRIPVLLLSAFIGTALGKACDPDKFECDNGMCIPVSWVCDTWDDCGDGSDELRENCLPCDPDTQWQCDNGRCIPSNNVCDRLNHCGDRSDENPDMCPSCTDLEFSCGNRYCVPIEWICDEVDDCGDGSDEYDAATGECPKCPAFTCVTSRRCLQHQYTCDGNQDCDDWSDEEEKMCPCAEAELRCSKNPGYQEPGACIPLEWVCDDDGIWDCPFGDDEANCTGGTGSLMRNRILRTSPQKHYRLPMTSKTSTMSKYRNVFRVRGH